MAWVDDNFNDNSLDSSKWSVYSGNPTYQTFNEQNQRLEMAVSGLPSGEAWGTLWSRYKWLLRGDFSIQVDFDVFASSTSDFWYVELMAGSQDETEQLLIKLGHNTGDSRHWHANHNSGGWGTGVTANVGNEVTSGKFRLRRIGSTGYMDYYDGSWNTLKSATIGTDDFYVFMNLYVGGTSRPDTSVAFDNFVVNSGEVIRDYSDNFDDNNIDDTAWGYNSGTYQTIAEQNQRLEMAVSGLPSGTAYQTFRGKPAWKLEGDFNIQVDFDLLNVLSQDWWHMEFFAVNEDESDGFLIRRSYESGPGNIFLANIYTNSSWGSASTTSASLTTGKLRLRRVGSTAYMDYYDGSWNNLHSGTVELDDFYVYMNLLVGGTSRPDTTVAFDNFRINSGTVEASVFYDINCDIRIRKEELKDINCDIRSVRGKEIKDINCDIRAFSEETYDINCDIRTLKEELKDINCDIRTAMAGVIPNILPNIDCDIRVLARTISDINCDIRVVEDGRETYDINCDIRVRAIGDIEPTPVGLDGFRVYLNSNEITDVQLDSIRYEWTMNEQIATASFRIVRKSDDFNETLASVAQAITTNLPIEIKFNGNLRWYGYVMSIDVEQSGESVIVNCLDRKQKIQEKLYDISYGRKWEAPNPGEHQVITGDYSRTGQAITRILNLLVSASVISSYSGVPTGIIPEYNETQGAPAGTLITELLDISGNFYWNVTPSGILQIYEASAGTIKNLPIQTEDEHVNLYDVINYDFKLNDRSNLITTVEVNMGTESEETRASYKLTNAGQISPAWDRSYDNLYTEYYGDSEYIDELRTVNILPHFRGATSDVRERTKEVGRKWQITNWTDGSFIDDRFEPHVIGFSNNKISGWSWAGQYLNLAVPLLEVKSRYSFYNVGEHFPDWWAYTEYKFRVPVLVGRFYRKEDVLVATNPTVFSVTWIGTAGAGATRKVTFSQLGIRDAIGWTVYEDGALVAKSEPAYDDTAYATDKARLMLSRMNDPVTEGNVNLTFDAFEYYGLKLGKRINLTQTNETDIYNENNGFSLDIDSIQFEAGSYRVTLNTRHYRNFKTTVNFR